MRDYEEENINQTEIIAMQCVGGEIEINTELLSIGLNIDNDNDPLPENHTKFQNIECFMKIWGILVFVTGNKSYQPMQSQH